MEQKPLSDLNAEATGGQDSAFEPSLLSTASTILPTIEEETLTAEPAHQMRSRMTAPSTTQEESSQEQFNEESTVSETENVEAQAGGSLLNSTQPLAESQLSEVYHQQGDAAALIEGNMIVDLPESSLVGHTTYHSSEILIRCRPTASFTQLQSQPLCHKSVSYHSRTFRSLH